MTSLRIIFMGTPDFAVPTLQALQASPHHVVAVYSQPPRPKGRGQTTQKTPVHQLADYSSIPVYTPANFKQQQEVDTFIAHQADVAVVVAYGLILPTIILQSPRLGCINSHASLLPRWRGAAPIQRSILNGDTQTGISFMRMEEGLDTGPIIGMITHPITQTTTTTELYDRLAQISADHIVPVLDEFASGNIIPQQQPSNGVTYAEKLRKEESVIDLRQSAVDIHRKIRALNPWPGTWVKYKEQVVKILSATLVDDLSGPAGTVLDDGLAIACGTGAIRPTQLQKQGGKPLPVADFLNGLPIKKGERFFIQ